VYSPKLKGMGKREENPTKRRGAPLGQSISAGTLMVAGIELWVELGSPSQQHGRYHAMALLGKAGPDANDVAGAVAPIEQRLGVRHVCSPGSRLVRRAWLDAKLSPDATDLMKDSEEPVDLLV
jgi:hypothetical protein